MTSEWNVERRAFLSTQIADRREGQLALAAVVVSAAVFVATAPFATRQLAPVPAFIPAYESALVVCNLITAVLLFGQFIVFRSRALFVLASGYLFTAFVACAHTLIFPGVFSPAGLLGAGPQSAVWLYMFWHGGFPIFVIAYALLKARPSDSPATGAAGGGAGLAILAGAAAILTVVWGLTVVATDGEDSFPVLITNGRYTAAKTGIVACLWALNALALAILWAKRPHTVLDLWLLVVMCAWLCDIALSAALSTSRFDLGWYAGRAYGLLAASFLLMVLLIENGANYARLSRLSVKLGVANQALERLSRHDGLTGLANRRFFDEYLAEQIAVAHRHQRTLALVLCDVDLFKAYNDHYGHQAGDQCLKRIATALRSCSHRPADMAARYGGEEFAMILPDTGMAGAARIAETMREAISAMRIAQAHSPAAAHVSISGGVAVLLREAGMGAQQLIAAADQALYEAKRQGRNRMVSAAAG
jgi:diguanylate cyclase (GGDEF)-like protein